jgi:hypothetical protein
MREIDRQTRVGRRSFLQAGAAAGPAVAVAAAGVATTPSSAWAGVTTNLTPHVMATLQKLARDIFPHDRLADKYYAAAIAGYDAMAADPGKKSLLTDGVARLDADAAAKYKVANYLSVNWEADRVFLIQAISHTSFFAKVRGDLVVSLYNQKEIWPKFGYEGSSAEHGGYIKRGFDDIDWLQS